jgi:hypothetical protein
VLTLDILAKSFNHLDVLPHHRDLTFAVLNRNAPTAFEEEEKEREEEDSEDDDRSKDDDRNKNRKASDGQSKEGVDEEKSFDFVFNSTTINLSQHPLLSKLVGEKDTIESGTVNALIWELFSLPCVKDRKLEFKFSNNTQGCLINVPTHTSEKGLLATAGRKGEKWIEAIIRQVSENAEDGAQWNCTYLGKRYEDAFKTKPRNSAFLPLSEWTHMMLLRCLMMSNLPLHK